ncbi:MAG: SGNH/GDSL hydrolase family protein [Proteobacteria bacterium]|nr:SGNH/GDSL hydrolase family protein [Pseudomonadota bacterium]
MEHVVLLGDSIFDNAAYVPGGTPVIDQLRQTLPANWKATLLAIDGNVTDDVPSQAKKIPADATHLVVSAGGNDALGESIILAEPAHTVGDALIMLSHVREAFAMAYRAMLKSVLALGKPTIVCTIYDAVPGLGAAESVALACFNDVILREAFSNDLSVIDLRLVCDRAEDYSEVSPIEPSMAGGARIARAIAEVVTMHDLSLRRSAICGKDRS